jgi:HlyD family secretion protein
MQRSIVVLLGVAALGGTVLLAWRGQPRPEPRVVHASSVTPSAKVAAEGRVVTYPGAEVAVAAERSGRLVRLTVQEGATVRRGDLLAEIESEELRAGIDEAQARLAEGEAQLRLADRQRARRAQLAADGVVASHDLDEADRDLEVARARLATTRAELARLQAQLRKSAVRAPIDGTVVLRHADAGEMVAERQLVVTLADLTRLRVEGEAHEADAASLRVGADVRITSDAYPGRSWRGTVEEVRDSVTPRLLEPQDPGRPSDTRVLGVKVAFAETSPLKLGTTVELQVQPRR